MDEIFHELLEGADVCGDVARSNIGLDADTTVRVPVEPLHTASTLVSALAATRNQLAAIACHVGATDITAAVTRLSSVVTEFEDALVHGQTEALEGLFATLPGIVREFSCKVGKTVSLVAEGAETRLDRQAIDTIRDPLISLIRHCVDHGLEAKEQRLAAGKPAIGTIRIAASRNAGSILIEISDDGRGLDLPQSGGGVTVSSAAGCGTRFTIRIPLTLTAAAGTGSSMTGRAGDLLEAVACSVEANPIVMFRTGSGDIKGLPLDLVKRIENLSPTEAERSAGRFITWRDDGVPVILPLIEGSASRDSDRPVLIVEMAGHTFGLLVDEIVDIGQVSPDFAVSSLVPSAFDRVNLDGCVIDIQPPFPMLHGAGVAARPSRSFEMTL